MSETCYRYEPKRNHENEQIADWLLRLTDNHRTWGFGLCYLYLRNVKGFILNHKRVYRIYKELELNLRDQASQANESGEARALDRATRHQRSLVNGFHALPADLWQKLQALECH